MAEYHCPHCHFEMIATSHYRHCPRCRAPLPAFAPPTAKTGWLQRRREQKAAERKQKEAAAAQARAAAYAAYAAQSNPLPPYPQAPAAPNPAQPQRPPAEAPPAPPGSPSGPLPAGGTATREVVCLVCGGLNRLEGDKGATAGTCRHCQAPLSPANGSKP